MRGVSGNGAKIKNGMGQQDKGAHCAGLGKYVIIIISFDGFHAPSQSVAFGVKENFFRDLTTPTDFPYRIIFILINCSTTQAGESGNTMQLKHTH